MRGQEASPATRPGHGAAGDFRERLLEECGGTWSIQEVSSRPSLPSGQIQVLIGRGHLVAVSLGEGEVRILSCQLAENELLPGLSGVLDALDAADSDFWAVLATLLEPSQALRDSTGPRSLLEALRAGEPDKALSATDFLYRSGGV